ncbi:putative methyltransferase [Actinomadura sp. KC216]|uniref:bis-aminopropyl spermidine synthase family protein n=1 Tax=Actinomadura sp. KC216 TaxID=2530370 RepID=UPI001052A4EF|nr:bis-aminopropyl spermidine synthase family protein [Actinomadura sp. KC216]TDB85207.1 putative methyltransferase [Actinomadura sp. KC216]
MDETTGLPDVEGMDPRRVHAALSLLADGRWWSLAALVRESAAPRRSVEALLAGLAVERDGDRFRLDAEQARKIGDLLAGGHQPFAAADPVGHLLPEYQAVVERVADFIARAPRGRHVLDHVAATPETVVRRALLLGARFWLADTRLLCVGDHDLTSLAVGMIHPQVETMVVDIDERILAYIDERAAELGLSIRTRWADLRLGLPGSAVEFADLAVTDPPYTPDGVGLFVSRAVQGLREQGRGRVLLAYGASDRTPTLALKVQNALRDLNLVSEAIYPDFNRYYGAEAIGSAADLYVLRPTSKSLPAAIARADRFSAAIYTQGPQAVEAREQVKVSAADLGDVRPDVLVGAWPKDVLPEVPRVRLSTWLAKPYAAKVRQAGVALPAGMEATLARVLLATRAERVRVVPAEAAGLGELTAVLEPVYELVEDGRAIEAVRRNEPRDDPASRILRAVMDRAHGKVANTWRDALIDVQGDLTKRQARALVAEAAPWAADVTLLELPMHRLRELPDAIRECLAGGRTPG